MAKEPFERMAMPEEIRAFIEQSVQQARTAFDGIFEAAHKAIGHFEGNAKAARTAATEIADKSIAYAEKNMTATFEFAEKLMQAKNPTEVMKLQSEFLGRQMQTISAQVQELGQTAAKIVMDVAKPKPKS